MAAPQFFKGDATELKYYNAAKGISDDLLLQKNNFFEQAFDSFILGEVLYDNLLSPLANAIQREIFRASFFTIFEAFQAPGSFEGYLTVFRKVFGDDVEVTFTVPGPGKLQIGIVTTNVEISGMITRFIVSNVYMLDTIVDDEGDRIVFQTIKGFETQYELEQMLFEMVPAGIWTEITLTIGEG